MWTKSEAAGADQQALWNTLAGASGAALAVVILAIALYLVKPHLFSARTNTFWEALLAPVLLTFQWLGMILPARGPWGRYVYRPAHLAA
jgi:hypothetical protein